MDAVKRRHLESEGWQVGDASEFLELSPAEAELIEVKLALGDYMREVRRQHHWTQVQVAERIGSSQSRVAKMESADASVSLDLLVKTLLTLGATTREVGRVISRPA
jgi:DNA-binding XRE family transcriptional regulator